MDLTKAMTMVAANAEVRKFARLLRKMGMADHFATMGLVPRTRILILPAMGLFAAGAACGAAAAMLLTPRTGEALRKDMGDLIGNMRNRAGARRVRREDMQRDANVPS